jgi:FAD:protein FMN transferase
MTCRARPLLGTIVSIRARGPSEWRDEQLHAAIDAAFAKVASVHSRMSFQDPCSVLSMMNRYAASGAVQIDSQTHEVLCAALRMAARSNGAFDPCAAEAASSSWRDIELLPDCRVHYHSPLRVDLGGIAKGYAVDLAIESLMQAGVESALVNAGGDLRVAGSCLETVWLRDPRRPEAGVHALTLCNESLATSAAYFARTLLDPKTRSVYAADVSVSVRTRDCMSADALTKVVLFAPDETADCVLNAYHAEAILLQPRAAAA